MKQYNKTKGSIGEHMACQYLIKKGYKIIEQNYRNQIGEIDIIAKDGDVLVFVEVKYKDSLYYGYPREMVTAQKQHKIRLTSMGYLKANRLYDEISVRFDVVEVVGDRVTHLIDAF